MKKKLVSLFIAITFMASCITLPTGQNTWEVNAKEPTVFPTSTMNFELKYVDCDSIATPVLYKRSQAATYFSGSTIAKDFLNDCSTDYAFLQLGNRTNAADLQALYKKIKTALETAYLTDKNVALDHLGPLNGGYDLYILETLSCEGLNIKEDEVMEVYQRVLSDHPLFFFPSGSLFWSKTDSSDTADIANIYLIVEEEFSQGSVRQNYVNQITTKIQSFETTVSGANGNYELAKKAHDRIMAEADYAFTDNGHGLIPVSTPFTHSIAGYVKDGKVVCDGYTKTFSAILNYFDIHSIVVTGWGNVENGKPTSPIYSHAWNLIQLDDGNYYFTDITWDDSEGYETSYFAKGTNDFYKDHSVIKKDDDELFTLLLELPTIPETDYHSAEDGFYKTDDPTFTAKEGYAYTWDTDTQTLTFHGTGPLETSESYSQNQWYIYAKKAKKIIVSDGITSIGQRAFYNFTALQTLIFPESILTFDSQITAKCKSLKTIVNSSDAVFPLEQPNAYDSNKLVYWKNNATGTYISKLANGTATAVYFGTKKSLGDTFTVGNIQYEICSEVKDLTLDELAQNKCCADVIATPLAGKCTVSSTIEYDGWNYRISTINVIKPATPSLKAKLYGHDDIHVYWSKVSNAAGYKISYKKTSSKSYTSLGETTNTYIKKPNLADNTSYTFKVVSYRIINGKEYVSSEKTIRIYTLKPIGKIKTLKGNLYGYNDFKFSWSKATNASGYKIYYKKASSKSYTYIGKTTSRSIKVPNLPSGIKYTFKIVPYESAKGSTCDGAGKTISLYTLKKVSTPTVSKASSSKVKIKWKNIGGESGYQISRSTKKSGTSIVTTYKTTSGTSKTVKTTRGKTYYYKVRAYKTVDGKKIYGPWSKVKAYKLK